MKNTHQSSQQAQLQALRLSLQVNHAAQSAELALALAGQGVLPIVELFSVCQVLNNASLAHQAIALYRLWLDQTASGIAYAVWFNLAVSLANGGDDAGAEDAYRRALALNPGFIEGHLNLATLLERKGEPVEALTLWNKVTTMASPNVPADRQFHLQALNNLGRLLEMRKQLPEADLVLTQSLLVDPAQPKVLTHLIHLRQKQCKWPIYQPIDGVSAQDMIDATSALACLSASGDPQEQLDAARRFVSEKVIPATAPLAPENGYRHDKLRIGYLSSDLCSHAVSILTVELFELHDRNLVEVYAFSWSREDGTPLRSRVMNAMDHYVRIGGMDDAQAARCIASHEIDILVDLHGLTMGTRPNILSWRPAPVQLTYLGFPGPTALPCIDYVIADKFLLPPELLPYFTERPLYLPNSFQVNDRQREIGARPTRAACGLPEDAFVFCSFNSNFKFTEEVFASWMRILGRVPGSVLWLVADHDVVRQNLCASAQRRGINPARLFFAGRVAPAEYLARYQVADLFLDTMPFNAGTTASDALWAGLPLLTCAGRTFASRMAGSLLLAVGLPQLITHDLQAYEDKAVELAENPELVAAMKRQLRDKRLSCALFDTPNFVRNLETAFGRVAKQPRPGKADTVMKKFTFGYIQHKQETHDRYLGKSLSQLRGEFEVIFTSDENFPAQNYNTLLDLCETEFLILSHQDVSFPPDLLESVGRTIASLPNFGALGMVGKDVNGHYRWSVPDALFEVDSLDCCFLIVRKDTPARFDTVNFGEYHLYVEDFCAQISRLQGKKIYTLLTASGEMLDSLYSPDFSAPKLVHHGATVSKIGYGWGRYSEFRAILTQKWGQIQTT